jgi:hypothetical protein
VTCFLLMFQFNFSAHCDKMTLSSDQVLNNIVYEYHRVIFVIIMNAIFELFLLY